MIKIARKETEHLNELIKNYDEIYGDSETVWSIDDLEELRKIVGKLLILLEKGFS